MAMQTTCNDFLGGRLRIHQPVVGYRAGIDPVLLAASVPAKTGDEILELGCGGGILSLAIAARVPGVKLTGIEIQEYYAELAQRNANENQIEMQIHCSDLTNLPVSVRQKQFDHVCANPPFFDRQASTKSQDTGRDIAMGLATDLNTWLEVAAKRLKPKGGAHFIYRADGLGKILAGLPASLGSIVITPITPRHGRDANLIMIHAIKNGRAALRIESSLVLHAGDQHRRDGDDYSEEITNVLRHGAGLTGWNS